MGILLERMLGTLFRSVLLRTHMLLKLKDFLKATPASACPDGIAAWLLPRRDPRR